MTDPNKDEILAMAREAGCAWLHEPLAQRFAALCRADLVAEVERLKKDLSTYDKRIVALSCIAMEDVHELLALQADRDDWKARALKAEQVGEADELLRNLGLDPNAYRTEGGHINHLKVKAAIKHPEDYIPQCQHAFAMSASYGGKLCKHCGKPEPQPAAQEPTSAAPVVRQMVVALERKLPGGKQTDDFESSRIGDYNQGWNDYRKAVKKMFKNINMNSSENSNPDAYLYSLEYGEKVVDTKVSIHQLNYPFGVAGADYLVRNDDGVSYVRQTKLYAALSRALAAGQKYLKENGK